MVIAAGGTDRDLAKARLMRWFRLGTYPGTRVSSTVLLAPMLGTHRLLPG